MTSTCDITQLTVSALAINCPFTPTHSRWTLLVVQNFLRMAFAFAFLSSDSNQRFWCQRTSE